jgi:putative thymidine phosphorylase
MKLIVKDMDIATGGPPVVILNQKDARLFDLTHMDRLLIKRNGHKVTAILDIAESSKAVKPGRIGLFEEALTALKAKHNDIVQFELAQKPQSLSLIKKKLEGDELSYAEYRTIVEDIVHDRLTTVELTAFVLAGYARDMSMKEIAYLTRAMKDTGDILEIEKRGRIITDLHSIGGVPGNRTTPIVVAILVAAGLIVPKTSSRAITSPAGTADTMEVLCSVSLPISRLKKTLDTVGGFIVWGGSVNLAPADDKIIQVERPLSIDAEGQMLASIMSKKSSVSATHLLIEIPTGVGAKVRTKKHARHLQRKFEHLGKLLKMHTLVMITDGSQPIGRGIGPILEMKDCLRVLMNHREAPSDLREKSIIMAGKLLEYTKKARKGSGAKQAQRILDSGLALTTFKKMLKAQKGKFVDPSKLKPGKYTFTLKAPKAFRVGRIDNLAIARIARLAGAPKDKGAGIELHVRRNMNVKKGDPLITIYAESKTKLEFARGTCKKMCGVSYLPISE